MWPFDLLNRPKVMRPHILLQQLEDRIVLDAAVNPAINDNPENAPGPGNGTNVTSAASQAGQASVGVDTALAPPPVPENLNQVFGADLNVVLISNSVVDLQAVSDSSVKDAQVIVFAYFAHECANFGCPYINADENLIHAMPQSTARLACVFRLRKYAV